MIELCWLLILEGARLRSLVVVAPELDSRNLTVEQTFFFVGLIVSFGYVMLMYFVSSLLGFREGFL
jgi:hypothetical protein